VSTDVRIGHLVLDGLELTRRERDALAPAIARELRMLAPSPRPFGARDSPGRPPSTVDTIAREVAVAVRGAIGPARQPTGRGR
jgi:hypothetical protein